MKILHLQMPWSKQTIQILSKTQQKFIMINMNPKTNLYLKTKPTSLTNYKEIHSIIPLSFFKRKFLNFSSWVVLKEQKQRKKEEWKETVKKSQTAIKNLEINKCDWSPICALHLQFQKSRASDRKSREKRISSIIFFYRKKNQQNITPGTTIASLP